MTLHYVFPPASAYRLNRCLFRLKSDDGFRSRYLADPEQTLTEAGVEGEARAALRAMDRERLVACGAHPYLIFIAAFRLRTTTDPAAFERF